MNTFYELILNFKVSALRELRTYISRPAPPSLSTANNTDMSRQATWLPSCKGHI